MRLKTLQAMPILTKLLNNETVTSDPAFTVDYRAQACQIFKTVLGYKHHPFFLLIEDQEDHSFTIGQRNDDVRLHFDIPDNYCAVHNFYSYSEYLYYFQEIEPFVADEFIDGIDTLDDLGRFALTTCDPSNLPLQITVEELRPEWLVSYEILTEEQKEALG